MFYCCRHHHHHFLIHHQFVYKRFVFLLKRIHLLIFFHIIAAHKSFGFIPKRKVNVDFISDFAFKEDSKTLLCPSGDGTLSVFDLKAGKLEAQSEHQEDELLSIAIIKHGRKVVTGEQQGALAVWSWGDWGDITDR